MSVFKNIKITCPDCKVEFPHVIWETINTELNPELKKKIMDETLFDCVCPHCNKKFEAPYSFLYHDVENRLMIQYNADETILTPFAEYVRILDNNLDPDTINMIAYYYRKNHPDENIVFLRIDEEKMLIFQVLTYINNVLDFTDRRQCLSMEEYLNIKKLFEQKQKDHENEQKS